MKTRALGLLLALVMVVCLLPVNMAMATVGDTFVANTAEGISVSYKVTAEGETNTVQVGDGSNRAIDIMTSGAITIPDTVTNNGITYTVTSIGDSAFFQCEKISSVAFPANLTSIGNSSFATCTQITSVTFPVSLTSIGNNAFAYCMALSSTNLSACTNLTSIGDAAFFFCTPLSNVTFPASLISIGESAFNGAALRSADLSACTSMVSISEYAFAYCVSLASVSLPTNLTTIEESAFEGTALYTVTLPASLTSIEKTAFKACTSLSSIIAAGATAPTLGENAFLSVTAKTYYPIAATGYTTANGWVSPTARATVSGVVRNASVSPVAGATVTIGAMTTKTNANGVYSFPASFDTESGEYTIYVSSESYNTGIGLVTLASSNITDADVTLSDYCYLLLAGAYGKHQMNTDTTWVIKVNGALSKFTGIMLDGVAVAADKFDKTEVEGSTSITLHADYLNTLAVGTHTLRTLYTDGFLDAPFTITAAEVTVAAADIPATGDSSNIIPWLAISVLTCAAVLLVVSRKSKYTNN